MFKNTLSIAATTIAVVASTSLPAAATGLDLDELLNTANTPVKVPEPATILGTLVVGGIGLMSTKKKYPQSKEEQK